MSASRLMRGVIYHERLGPRPHAFRNRSGWCYVDLAELPELFDGTRLWSSRRGAPLWFRAADYMHALGPDGTPLDHPVDTPEQLHAAVLARMQAKLGRVPTAPRVRILTQIRSFGFVFNPVSFYFVFEAASEGQPERLAAILVEITNTPWGERFCYAFDAKDTLAGETLEFRFPKEFHVSPFFDIDHDYHWRFRLPNDQDESLEVHMTNERGGIPVFHSGMRLTAQPVTASHLRRAALSFPFMTLRVHPAIYLHAAILWIRRTPFFTHPKKRAPEALPSSQREQP